MGGRAKGVPNKNKRGLKAQLKQQYGADFNILMTMAGNCVKLQALVPDVVATEGDIEATLAANAQWKELAPYVEPKLKQIDVDVRATEVPYEDWLASLDDDDE